MKHSIKKFMQLITHKRTQDIFYSNVVDIVSKNEHVVIFVDNVKPVHELSRSKHDEQIKKVIDRIYGEQFTYEVRLVKNNVIHERSVHVMRHGSP